MKKVLIVVYYWPPSGGGGVQRWLKFVKYLPEMGWQPIIYTPENPDFPIVDKSLLAEVPDDIEVIKTPIWEPRKLYYRLLGKKKSEGGGEKKQNADQLFYLDPKERSWKQNLSIWIRGNLFIPDARMPWIRPSVRFLKKYLAKNPVDVVVTSGPPHSLHVIGLKLKRQLGEKLTWVADFRDPWTEIEFYEKMMLSRWADRKHRSLEKAVLREADAEVKATYYWIPKDRELGAKYPIAITNGYDDDDFSHEPPPLSKHFLLSHIGTLNNDRNPHLLWQALGELARELPGFKEDLRVEVVGKTDPLVVEAMDQHGLKGCLLDPGYVKHDQAVLKMQAAQVLLLLINDVSYNAPGRMTGKIFEYLAARRPILLIGPKEGDAAKVVRMTQSGEVAGFQELDRLKDILKGFYQRYKKGNLQVDSAGYEKFSRRSITRQMADLFDELPKEKT
jgi:glycosyltransferase involved in cell wall biosynthesis